MPATVTRRRTSIWLGEEGAPANWDVHSEDDMIMIEAQDGKDELEVFLCPALFPQIRAVMDRLEELDRTERP